MRTPTRPACPRRRPHASRQRIATIGQMEPPPEVAEETPNCYRHADRPTLVSCSNCDRPICTACMVQAAVGIRCPECAGRPSGVGRLKPRAAARGTAYVTKGLVAVNVVAFVLQFLTDPNRVGRGIGGTVSENGWLRAVEVWDGEWWRIVTGAFLHAGVVHLAFNMIALWVLGQAFEGYVGPLRFGLIYAASVTFGSAGALLSAGVGTPTVGASGGVFGLMAAVFLLERQRGVQIIGDAGVFLAINLAISFFLPGISIGGHLGGVVGGALAAFALSGFGKGHMAGRRLKPGILAGVVGLVVVGFVLAIVIADRKVDRARFADAAEHVTVPIPEPVVLHRPGA